MFNISGSNTRQALNYIEIIVAKSHSQRVQRGVLWLIFSPLVNHGGGLYTAVGAECDESGLIEGDVL